MIIHGAYHDTCRAQAECDLDRRALALWPGLDRRALARCRHEMAPIVRLVARRSSHAPATIRALLMAPLVTREEVAIWFG
ncbi:MAG: hypothetical protein ACLQHS_05290 [Candidatus Limnocylindrales bacterium]|jgi:hypothetical protein